MIDSTAEELELEILVEAVRVLMVQGICAFEHWSRI